MRSLVVYNQPLSKMPPKKNTKSAAAAAAAASASASIPTENPVVPATDASSEDAITTTVVPEPSNTFELILKEFAVINGSFKDLAAKLKVYEKEHKKLVKASQKGKQPRANNGVKRNPSGFAKPARLNDDLCNFLSLPLNSELPRTKVTSELHSYIIREKLQNAENRKIVNPDAVLMKLLNIQEGNELSYFNLQKYMKHLFVPNVPVAV